jgi:hypothetical protein
MDLPDGTQTEKVGDTLLGDADNVILAVPLVPLLSQTQMAYLTVVCGSTELTLLRVWTFRHKVPLGAGVVGEVVGVGVTVGDGDGDGDDVGVAVALGDFNVPPGVSFFESVLFAGAGSGSVVLDAADEFGLGCGRAGGLALGLGWVLGWVLGNGGVLLAEASGTAWARSTGMLAGCWARPLTWLAVRVLGCIPAAVVLGAGLLGAAAVQGFDVAWRVPCTPVSIMLTAP